MSEGFVDGIKTHLNCSTPVCYQGGIMSGPVCWPGPARVLHDPAGIARWGEACRKQFFEDNPNIAKATHAFVDGYQRWERDRSTAREFETFDDFVRSIDRSAMVINYESFANQALEATL